MKIRTSEIFSLLFTLSIVFSASFFATITSSQELPRSQVPNDNQRKSRPTLNANSDADQAKTASAQTTFAVQIRTALRSSLETSLEKYLTPEKVVLSCDAVELFQRVGTQTIASATSDEYMRNVKDETGTKKMVSQVQDRFDKFLEAQVEGGEKLRSGKVLITGESFNATAKRFCPLIPIC